MLVLGGLAFVLIEPAMVGLLGLEDQARKRLESRTIVTSEG